VGVFMVFLTKTSLHTHNHSYPLSHPPFLAQIGLSENELVGRRLEHFAISTGTGVLHELGFSTTAMYFDLMSLMIYLLVTLALAFVVLKVCVREMR